MASRRIFSDRLSIGQGLAESGSRFIERLNQRRDAERALRLEDELRRRQQEEQYRRQQETNERLLREQNRRDEVQRTRQLEDITSERKFLLERAGTQRKHQLADVESERKFILNREADRRSYEEDQAKKERGARRQLEIIKGVMRGGGAFSPPASAAAGLTAKQILDRQIKADSDFVKIWTERGGDLGDIAKQFGMPEDSTYQDLRQAYQQMVALTPEGGFAAGSSEQQEQAWATFIQDSTTRNGPVATARALVHALHEPGRYTEEQINLAEDVYRRLTGRSLEAMRQEVGIENLRALDERGIAQLKRQAAVQQEAAAAIQQAAADLSATPGNKATIQYVNSNLAALLLDPDIDEQTKLRVMTIQAALKPYVGQRFQTATAIAGYGANLMRKIESKFTFGADDEERMAQATQAMSDLGKDLSLQASAVEEQAIRLDKRLAQQLQGVAAAADTLGAAP